MAASTSGRICASSSSTHFWKHICFKQMTLRVTWDMFHYWIPYAVDIIILILCLANHHTLHTVIRHLCGCSCGQLDSECLSKKSQMRCPMLVASKHVVLPCGVLNIHCHHHQSVKVCCSLEHPLYKWRQYFNGMLAQTSIALPLLPIVPSQFCQVIMLRVPWGLLQLQSQLPVLALQSLMEQFISWIFHPDEPCKNWSILPPLDQLTGSSLSSFSGLSFRLSPLWYHRLYPSLDYATPHGLHWCSIAFCGWLKKRRVH